MLGERLTAVAMTSTETLLVLSTCGQRGEADALAEALVSERLAACVNVVPGIHSVYEWQGRIERSEEVLLLIKTTRGKLAALEEAIRARSSYELPEVLAVPVTGLEDYLRWVAEAVS